MKLIDALGLDWKILLIQLGNFLILLWLLKKFGFGPIMKFVEERTATIEEGVKNAEDAKTLLANAQEEQQKLLAEARTESQSIIAAARDHANQQGEALVQESKAEAQKVVDKAKRDIASEHQQMLDSAKSEISELVLTATEKVLRQKVDDSALVDQLVQEQMANQEQS